MATVSVVTDAGKALITSRLKGEGAEPAYVSWGVGAGTAAVTDTTLSTESTEARTLGTSSIITTATTDDTYKVIGAIVATGARVITNAGLLTAASDGVLFLHSSFDPVTLAENETIAFTISAVFG